MITKLTSIKTAIAKVIADLGLEEDEIKISDFREWAAEAIEKIGAVQQFEHIVSGVEGLQLSKYTAIKHSYLVTYINYTKLHILLIVMGLGFL